MPIFRMYTVGADTRPRCEDGADTPHNLKQHNYMNKHKIRGRRVWQSREPTMGVAARTNTSHIIWCAASLACRFISPWMLETIHATSVRPALCPGDLCCNRGVEHCMHTQHMELRLVDPSLHPWVHFVGPRLELRLASFRLPHEPPSIIALHVHRAIRCAALVLWLPPSVRLPPLRKQRRNNGIKPDVPIMATATSWPTGRRPTWHALDIQVFPCST